jgi:hypothetical protein
VNRFRGFLVPRPDWIKVLYLFGTLGLHRLFKKTLQFSKNFKISKISKIFKICIRLQNFQKISKNSKFSKKCQNSKIKENKNSKVQNFTIFTKIHS